MGFLEGILYMLWRGIAIGVIISAPMGPVGILCVQRTLAKGRKAGFYTGVGAAISDLMYCLITGFGLSFIEEFLERNQNVIQIIGSVVLIGFAIYLFRSNPSRSIKKPGDTGSDPKKDIINGFLFTVSNPLIIFLIIGLFARFNFLLPEIKIGHYFIGFLCIIMGALGWWWMVTFFVDKVRAHFNLRSMWLINKIIGSIIAIFGVVGIITATAGIANAETRNMTYLNSTRGFGPLGTESDTVLMIDGNSDNPARVLELAGREFELRFRARNLHNETAKKYPTAQGKVVNPGWHIRISSPEDSVTVNIHTIDDYRNELGPKALSFNITRGDTLYRDLGLRDHLNWGTGWNSFVVSFKDGCLRLSGGERKTSPITEIDLAGFAPSAAAIGAEPGALLDIDWIDLWQAPNLTANMNHLADPDVRRSYLQHSPDPMEGQWEIWERSLEENQLQLGGNYRFILADDGSDYELIYLSGATKNPGRWKPGMLKARLTPTAFKNVFDVSWIDVNGNLVDEEIKAQYSAPSLLIFQFPHFQSTLQLRKVAQ